MILACGCWWTCPEGAGQPPVASPGAHVSYRFAAEGRVEVIEFHCPHSYVVPADRQVVVGG